MEPAESEVKIANQRRAKYVMPGLCPKIVQAFRRRRGVIPTPRTLAMNMAVEPSVATTALIHELFEQVDELREIVSRRPPASEFKQTKEQGLRIVARRVAA